MTTSQVERYVPAKRCDGHMADALPVSQESSP